MTATAGKEAAMGAAGAVRAAGATATAGMEEAMGAAGAVRAAGATATAATVGTEAMGAAGAVRAAGATATAGMEARALRILGNPVELCLKRICAAAAAMATAEGMARVIP